jgi:hypothetical protein
MTRTVLVIDDDEFPGVREENARERRYQADGEAGSVADALPSANELRPNIA